METERPLRTVEAALARVKALKADVGAIPKGMYCYRPTGETTTVDGLPAFGIDLCPYWAVDEARPYQDNGYCAFMRSGDWDGPGIGLLWDQVKSCGLNDEDDEDPHPRESGGPDTLASAA